MSEQDIKLLNEKRESRINMLREETRKDDSCPWCAVITNGYPYLRLIGIDGFVNAHQVDSGLTMCPKHCPFCGTEFEEGFDTESVTTLPGFQRIWPGKRDE